MKRVHRIYYLLALSIFSCDTTSTVDLPKRPPKLVVNCIGQNDVPFAARISTSKGILEDAIFPPTITNAAVKLYENDSYLETLSFLDDGDYGHGALYKAKNLYPKPGNRYKIEVTATPYEPIYANYTQPLNVAPQSLEMKVLGKSSIGSNIFDVQFKISFTDPPEENYYQVFVRRKSENVQTPQYSQGFYLLLIDPAYTENNDKFYQTTAFADTYFNGTNVTLDFKSFLIRNEFPPTFYFDLYIRNLSKEYYNYLKTSNLQRLSAGDPFAQPVQVENNIKNGYGIFAGYTESRKSFYIEY